MKQLIHKGERENWHWTYEKSYKVKYICGKNNRNCLHCEFVCGKFGETTYGCLIMEDFKI